MSTSLKELEELRQYSACDISDALLALSKKNPSGAKPCGFLSDLRHMNPSSSDLPPYSTSSTSSPPSQTIIYPAFTVQFQPTSRLAPKNIPAGRQWSDLATVDSIVVIQQPPAQTNACVGGIHMLRLAKLGVRGLVVDGRVRDLSEMDGLGLPVWAKGVSTVGAGAGCSAMATHVPVSVCGVRVESEDFVCLDEKEGGVVCISRDEVGDVLAWLKKRGNSEDLILEAVRQGSTVEEAFKKYR